MRQKCGDDEKHRPSVKYNDICSRPDDCDHGLKPKKRRDRTQPIFVIFLKQAAKRRLSRHRVIGDGDTVGQGPVKFKARAAHVPIMRNKSKTAHIVPFCPCCRFQRIGTRIYRLETQRDAALEILGRFWILRLKLGRFYVAVHTGNQQFFGLARFQYFEPAINSVCPTGQHNNAIGWRYGRRLRQQQRKPSKAQHPEQQYESEEATDHNIFFNAEITVKRAISMAHIVTASGMRPQFTRPETDTPSPESKAGIAATHPSSAVTPVMAAAPRPGRSRTLSNSNRICIAATNGTNGMTGQRLFRIKPQPEKTSSTAFYNTRVASHKMLLFRHLNAACMPLLPHTLCCP